MYKQSGEDLEIGGATRRPRQWLGHPVGLAYVVVAEGAAYFAYSGLQSLLTLYLTQQTFAPEHAGSVIGLTLYRSALEALFGPMSLIGLASQTFGMFTGLMYALPLLGALVADRWVGQRLAVVLGAVVITLGYALIASQAFLLFGLAFAIVGNGLLRTNLLGQLGRLYEPGDQRSTRGFGAYQIALSLGAFLSPLVCGSLVKWVGWHAGLAAPAVAGLQTLVAFLAGRRHMPVDNFRRKADGTTAPARLRRGDGATIVMLLALLAVDTLFFGAYNQTFDILPIWAEAHVDRTFGGFTMPTSWLSSADGLLTIIGTALSMRLWAWQARRGREPGVVAKITVGICLGVAAFGVLVLGAASETKTPIGFTILYLALIDTGVVWTDLVVLSTISRLAPPAVSSTMLGLYLMTTMISNLLVGWFGTFYERTAPAQFWGLHGLFIAIMLPLVIPGTPWLRRRLVAAGEMPDLVPVDAKGGSAQQGC